MVRLSLGLSLVAVCISIGSFVAVQLQSNPAPWEPSALNRFGYVLLVLAVAVALVVERRASLGAWQAQVAAAGVAVAFVIVALVKTYSSSHPALAFAQAIQWGSEAGAIAVATLAFGLVGPRNSSAAARIGFLAAALAGVGSASYALSLESSLRAEVWYLIAATAAFLAGSSAARMQTDSLT